MKTRTFLWPVVNRLLALLAVVFASLTCHAQLASPSPVPGNAGVDYTIARMGPHSVVWQDSIGQSVTAIATGMNYSPDGVHWLPSDNSFAISPDGSAFVAEKIQDPTRIAANINTVSAVNVVTPNGVTLSSTPVAIGLFDPVSGKSIVVAAITNTSGVLVDAQHLVFSHAFVGGGFDASVVYSLPDTGSFHQDVVFTSFAPNFDPTVWGFAAESTNQLQIEIFTEYYGVPQPQYVERPLYIEQNPTVRTSMSSPDFIDYTLDWGNYVLGPGRAYTTTTNAGAGTGAAVAKDFVTSNGRTFLVESVRYQDIAKALQSLPPLKVRTSSLRHLPGARRMKVAAASIPSLKAAKKGSVQIPPVKAVASSSERPRGLSVDYFAAVSGTGPTLFSSDTTYFVAGNVYLSGSATIENAVFKYPTAAGYIDVEGALTLATTNYRSATFTAADDDSAGAALSTGIWSGYTGNPSGKHYGSVALWLQSTANIALNNLRFCYQNCAIEINADTMGQSLSLSHSQLVDCITAINVNGGGGSYASLAFSANNCLLANIDYSFVASTIKLTGSGCNCTVDTCTNLLYMGSGTSGTFNFTNSIFSTLTTQTSAVVTLGGAYNGFYSSPTFGSIQTNIHSSPYVTAGAGNYYLQPNSPFLTAATTNVGALRSQLQAKTTQAPSTLTGTIASYLMLGPVVQRDTTGTALGFHYDPIDYLASCSVSYATLVLTNGVVLAYYQNPGISLLDGSQLISQGAPTQRNYLAYYNLVQEQPKKLSTGPAQSQPIVPIPSGSSANPTAYLRLTTITAPTGETTLLNTGDNGTGGQVIGGLTVQDCEIYGAGASWQMNESANEPSISFANNVFHRIPFAVNSNAKITSYNNLFYGTTNVPANDTSVTIHYRAGSSGSPNTHENNVFDGIIASLDGNANYNAYLRGATDTTYGANDLQTTVSWAAGPLGSYYQPTGSPLLNKGSTSAANLGLNDYTVLTSEAIEGAGTVSMGYHYVALGASGSPLVSIAITSPQNNSTCSALRLDAIGTVTSWAPVQSVTVNGTIAYLNGSAFTAKNIPLASGANQLVVIATDAFGNTGQSTVTVTGSSSQTDPLDLIPSVTEGYAPLTVNFTLNASGLPGTVQSVAWDWQGDGIPDLTVSTLAGQSYTYSAGTYFPVVTVTTSQGTFSTIGGNNANMENSRVTIVADATPSIVWSQSVSGPVAVKANADGSVYVLGNNPPTITLYSSSKSVLRSLNLTTLGLANPVANGFDADSSGNVYLAMTAIGEVYKLSPSGTSSYAPVSTFNANAFGYLASPWDVAVSQTTGDVFVSDSGTQNQLVQFNPDGTKAAILLGFSTPEGLSFDPAGRLVVANTGANQVLITINGSPYVGFSQSAIKASGDSSFLYVTDGTRVQAFDAYSYGLIRAVPTSVGLKNPRSVSVWPSQSEERLYIADYGNNRVIAVTFPQQNSPLAVWNSMVQAVSNKNLNQAISYFSMFTSVKYSAEFQQVGLANVSSVLSQLPALTIIESTSSYAHYVVTVSVNGVPLTFYINFANENGLWKISSF